MSGTSESANTNTPAGDQIVRRKGSGRTGAYIVAGVVIVVVIILLAGYFGAGWFKSSTSSNNNGTCTAPASTTVSGAGSTLVAPLMTAWALSYTASTVNYASVGSGAGISDITSKTVDFGASDAPLNPAQRTAIPSPGVLTIPESIGAAVPIYNLPSVSGTLKFTGQVLAGIYMQAPGYTNWNNSALQAINPGVTLPNANIVVVHRSDGSGTTFAFSSFLALSNATWAATYGHATTINWPTGEVGSKGNSGVTGTVKSTEYAIGYVDINYALTESVAFGAVKNPAGNYIVANITNIASAVKDASATFPTPAGDWYNFTVENSPGAQDYPIATFTYLFVYTDLGVAYGSSMSLTTAENLVNLLLWMVSDGTGQGQTFAAGLYYVPLSTAAATFDTNAIDSITYNGAAITHCVAT